MRHLAAAVGLLAACAVVAADPVTNCTLTGIVRDPDGKPVTGASVRITGSQGGLTTYQGGMATSGPDGRYSIRVLVHRNEAVLLGVRVRAASFVQFDDRYNANLDAPLLYRGRSTELDFTLARGEVIAGGIAARPSGLERLRGATEGSGAHVLKVRGPSFAQTFAVQGTAFEEFVPPGRYTVELLQANAKLAPARLENVAAGSRGLHLTAQYPKITPEVAAKAFDALAEDMGLHYSYFELKKVNWPAVCRKHRPKAAVATDLKQFVDALQDLLTELRDGHVWINWPGEEHVPTALPKPRPVNFNRQVTLAGLTGAVAVEDFAVVGRTKADGFAALVLTKQSAGTPALVARVVEFILSSRDAPGFLVDLRDANGGNELLAREIAQQFCGKDVAYAKSRYRNGPEPGDLGPAYDRELTAVTSPYLKPVVCLIGDRAVSSGEGFVKMMRALPHVTTVGARTRGSSGNPKPFKLPGLNVTVYYSRWVDLLPDGTPVEDRGVAPQVPVDAPAEAYRDADPTWEKAQEVLREAVKKAKP